MIYPSKNSKKNSTWRRMKKCFNETFQKCTEVIMNRLSFEMAAFCFDDESEIGFHWSARTSHQFFVQLGPSWLTDCLQEDQIGAVLSWNVPLQNRPDRKVYEINIRAWRCPHLLVPEPSWSGPAPPHWHPRLRTAVWAKASSCMKIYLFSKVSVSQGRTFFM